MPIFDTSDFTARGRNSPVRAVLLFVAIAAQGCAHVSVDEDGTRHVVGLVSLTLPPVDAEGRAAEAFRTRSIGITITKSEIETGIVVGYSDLTLAFIRDNRVVVGNALRLETKQFNQVESDRRAP
jgi:hypothetical protein